MGTSSSQSIVDSLSRTFTDFFRSSTSGGIVLLVSTVCALGWANSPWSDVYFSIWERRINLGLGDAQASISLFHFINDVLMAIFFFIVGLEIKRELLVGELSSLKKSLLPIIAAIGGMIGPAVIYWAFTQGHPEFSHGWGIPMATDIAFALGILALLGKRIPSSLKIFLAALAIADDMGAVIVIALFYSSGLSPIMLAAAAGCLILLAAANRMNIKKAPVYVALGALLWYCIHLSGIHATIAGVLLAITIPVRPKIDKQSYIETTKSAVDDLESVAEEHDEHQLIHHIAKVSEDVRSPLHRFERMLQPYVSFLIMPVFAFANAGVAIEHGAFESLVSPVGLGIAIGLIAGKQIGILAAVWGSTRVRLAELPTDVTWPMLYGTTWLCGIGFTMALFIANLAFTDAATLAVGKIAILTASVSAAVVGSILLVKSSQKGRL
ncbi:MAG TPA: Na+/H+ antiporter NhaA [Bacteroidota bacterium]|nr:Na+/H+ antiporter NhaA [Bacteroidota bacterium]